MVIVFLPIVTLGQSILLEGRIVDKEDLTPLHFAHILKHKKTIELTPLHAKFSLMVNPHDTLVISHIGYKKHVFVVPEDAQVRLDTTIFMTRDTTILQEVKIYGFPTERAFKRQIIATDALTKELRNAQNNVYQSQQLYKYGVVPEMDALDNYKAFVDGPQPVVFFSTNSSIGLGTALKKAFTSQYISFTPQKSGSFDASTPLLKNVKFPQQAPAEDSVKVQQKIVVNSKEEKK